VSQERSFQFEWDENEAAFNLRKHGVAFELASTTFLDSRLPHHCRGIHHVASSDRVFPVSTERKALLYLNFSPTSCRAILRSTKL